MWLWTAVTSMPFARNALITGLTSSPQNKISRDSGLAATGRLETDGIRDTHRSDRTYLHSILRHRIAARHCKLIDAAVRLPFDANDLIELRGVEIDRRWSGCGWRR